MPNETPVIPAPVLAAIVEVYGLVLEGGCPPPLDVFLAELDAALAATSGED